MTDKAITAKWRQISWLTQSDDWGAGWLVWLYMAVLCFSICYMSCPVLCSLYVKSYHYIYQVITSMVLYHYVNTNRCSHHLLSSIVVISLLGLLYCGVPAPMELFLWLTCCDQDLPRSCLSENCWGRVSDPFLVGVVVHPCKEIGPCWNEDGQCR